LIGELGLIKFSEVGVGGFRHTPEVEYTFLVRLQIHEWEIEAVEVILGDDNYGLLGRDMLNRFLPTLDGPVSVASSKNLNEMGILSLVNKHVKVALPQFR